MSDNIGLYNPLSSITELRSKGESRRFIDEIGYLFEGLDAKSSIGLSRSSALEMIAKFCDQDFMKRAKAAGFVTKAWEVLRSVKAGEGDKVFVLYETGWRLLIPVCAGSRLCARSVRSAHSR